MPLITPVNAHLAGVEKKELLIGQLTNWILSHLEQHTAGSPTDESVKWTHLRPCDISLYIKDMHKVVVSNSCIKRILKAQGYRHRKPSKSLSTGESPHRKEQFEIILFLVALFWDMEHNPIISIDTKKKELLGELTRNKTVLCQPSPLGKAPQVFDHDFPFLAKGKAIPHGIFDVKLNKGYISIGNSHETAAFVVDNLDWWWQHFGKELYPNATYILILCDSGGANGHRHHLFKKHLQDLAKNIDKRLVIVHYPPYCSKYNPIERKLFTHVHRTIEHTILTDLQQVKELIAKTATTTGLSVEVRLNDTFYPTKQPSNAEDIDKMRILRHPTLPNLSYTILP
jgi:Rhodopirellula transposase DDE domain